MNMGLPSVVTEQDRLLTINIYDQIPVTDPIDGVEITPLFLDRENGTWVLYAVFKPGTVLPKHFHTGTVHFFTTKGRWHYREYPQDEQVAGSYLYEPGGSIHQFCVPDDATESAEGFMVVSGANINFDESDVFLNIMDAGAIETGIVALCQALGREPPRYITPGRGAAISGI
jgi:2,4'-dihydroxyacetophenone dioxygenase